MIGTSIPAWTGWIARLDGSAAALLRYNHAFLGIEVTSGHHRLELRYRPASVALGAGVSVATVAALVLLGTRRRRGASLTDAKTAQTMSV